MYVYDFAQYTTNKAKFSKLMVLYRLLLYIVMTTNYSKVNGIKPTKTNFECVQKVPKQDPISIDYGDFMLMFIKYLV